jgi:hypothetical protein
MHYVSLSCSAPPPGACGSKVTERKSRADGAWLSPRSTLAMQATDHVQDWSILYGRANGYMGVCRRTLGWVGYWLYFGCVGEGGLGGDTRIEQMKSKHIIYKTDVSREAS